MATTKQGSTKTTSKQGTSKSTSKQGSTESTSKQSGSQSSTSRAGASSKRSTATDMAAAAARQLLEVVGRSVEGVTGLKKTDDGWQAEVEILEVRRIPDTTDVLALYQVELDADGDLIGYHRARRYSRGSAQED